MKPQAPARVELAMTGVVQGVGFRPYIHRLAMRYDLSGWVRNESGVVRVVAQGSPAQLAAFQEAVRAELPPLARIDSLGVQSLDPQPMSGFRVVSSDVRPSGRLPICPDVALCSACEAEMRDPENRRYRYAFTTCTDCGPRFTVIEEMPYDRERTSMRVFTQCAACQREYSDPSDRRYHSETNSCAACGPTVVLESGITTSRGEDAIAGAGRRLLDGEVLAVRGLGGFHLAVDARSERAVERLRSRKGRDAKPLAVMVESLDDARRLGQVSRAEEALLVSAQRPIVLLHGHAANGLASGIAPGLDTVGVMLAYAPLHFLLLDAVEGRPLVMTSGNLSDEPIATGNEEARQRLSGVADAFLMHDRDIVARYDDSVVRVVDDQPVFLRRSRGYAPMPLRLPVPTADGVLAVGPHLKNTFTLAQGRDAWVSQHIGDLENLETLEHFSDARARFQTLFRIEPRWVVRDLHPGYLSTTLAAESGLPELEPVQHHHAHIAAVLGEHDTTSRSLGLAFDGTGYGTDGRVWGCEFLDADLTDFERLTHLRYAPLPGGDLAARAPWRCLLGYAMLDPDRTWAMTALGTIDDRERSIAMRQVERGLNAPLASSMGRLFDAAAAVLGVRLTSRYEGQAAMELEALAGSTPAAPLPFPLTDHGGPAATLDPLPLLRALASGRARGMSREEGAAAFHESVVQAAARVALRHCEHRRLDSVALAGGCFQNVRLLSSLTRALNEAGVEVLLPHLLGPNDGAISYGQAVVASARLSMTTRGEPSCA